MSDTLQSIMIDLKNGTDINENVINLSLVSQAIDRLELYPMSMVQLEETRVAQLLQIIRRQVESHLQKRIRAIIKAWQKLLEPGSAYSTIIPREKRSITTSASSSDRHHFPRQPICSTSHSSSGIISNNNGDRHKTVDHDHRQLPPVVRIAPTLLPVSPSPTLVTVSSPARPPLRTPLDRSNGSTPALVSSPKINGQLPVSHQLHSEKRTSLAKVKSTAELMQEAGGCIDSITKDRILYNRITKESDVYPRVVPLGVGRTPRQPRAVKQTSHPPPTLAHRPISEVKSEMMDMFLENTVSLQQQQRQQREEELRNHQTTIPSIKPCSSSTDFLERQIPNQTTETDLKHRHKDKKKHKRKVKHDSGDGHISKHHRRRSESSTVPITNRMDDWPKLPPVVPANVEMGPQHSGETPTGEELEDRSNVTRLLTGTWPEINAVRDGENRLQSMTSLFSVGLDEDQLVHVLPWVNLSEYRQSFFPSDSNELDQLMNLPDPW